MMVRFEQFINILILSIYENATLAFAAQAYVKLSPNAQCGPLQWLLANDKKRTLFKKCLHFMLYVIAFGNTQINES